MVASLDRRAEASAARPAPCANGRLRQPAVRDRLHRRGAPCNSSDLWSQRSAAPDRRDARQALLAPEHGHHVEDTRATRCGRSARPAAAARPCRASGPSPRQSRAPPARALPRVQSARPRRASRRKLAEHGAAPPRRAAGGLVVERERPLGEDEACARRRVRAGSSRAPCSRAWRAAACRSCRRRAGGKLGAVRRWGSKPSIAASQIGVVACADVVAVEAVELGEVEARRRPC